MGGRLREREGEWEEKGREKKRWRGGERDEGREQREYWIIDLESSEQRSTVNI